MAPLGQATRKVAAGPVIASFAQSSNFGGAGVAIGTVENMSDGLPEPFVGTNNAVGAHLTATLAADAFVTSVTLAASTVTGGWGADYLNGASLQWSLDGSNWAHHSVLSGFTHGSFQTIPLGVTCRYVRVIFGVAQYLAVGEFTVQ